MRWRYSKSKYRSTQKTARSSTYKPKYFFSEKEIDFTLEHLDYNQFILQEFFTADNEMRLKMDAYYLKVYGSRALAYLHRKYLEWAVGDYHLTDLMRERIITMMPHFLSEQAKHKLGLFEFMSSIKKTIKSFLLNQESRFNKIVRVNDPNEVSRIFQNEYERIQEIEVEVLKNNVITVEEKIEALEISKYILEEKLIYQFLGVQSDLESFVPFLKRCTSGIFSCKYTITQFNLEVFLNPGVNVELEPPAFALDEVEVDSRFKLYAEQYLAYELMNIQRDMNVAICNSFLNVHDMGLFFNQYDEILRLKKQAELRSTFQGEGGVLSLNVQIKPLRKLLFAIFTSLLAITVISIMWWFTYQWLRANSSWIWIFLVLGGWLIIATFSAFFNEIKSIWDISKQIRSKRIFVNK